MPGRRRIDVQVHLQPNYTAPDTCRPPRAPAGPGGGTAANGETRASLAAVPRQAGLETDDAALRGGPSRVVRADGSSRLAPRSYVCPTVVSVLVAGRSVAEDADWRRRPPR
jgi:hypothetical protein